MNENKILKALMMAAEAHKGQRRKAAGGSPYVNHLIEVAYLLTDCAKIDDYRIIQAAILHDILEDTDVTESALKDQFDQEVLDYVKSVTDDKLATLAERRQFQIDHLPNASAGTKLIKLADHCSNIASIPEGWDQTRISEYLSWSSLVASMCFTASTSLATEYKSRLSKANSQSE